ncbi:MAG: RluA family pseudouridine synthase [Candidatus Sumerlaeia bacterium]|nr:RluA family pseudouridine synthase [Candidatus Sumerlaeia bacterium]
MSIEPRVIHEDDHLLVLDKPPGISLLSERHGGDALWPVIRERYQDVYTVHRLDKGTSGVLLVAKSKVAQASLNRQFHDHVVRKYYLAVVSGVPNPSRALVDLPLVKGRKNTYRIAALRSDIHLEKRPRGPAVWHVPPGCPLLKGGGFPSQTHFRVLKVEKENALVLLNPLTGRTHQIRVHMGWLGHPLLGDQTYNRDETSRNLAGRLALHCHRMAWLNDWADSGRPRWQAVSSPITREGLLGVSP